MLVYLWLIIYDTNGLSMNLDGYFIKVLDSYCQAQSIYDGLNILNVFCNVNGADEAGFPRPITYVTKAISCN